ncbi:hypothetical protein [Nonomuraea sp. NPDC049480]|uniref:hypothetical protein n=1 Tax=Nonomuraea sp. NPDC049480 TaxID=3364353 RepID=UPI0037954138
MDVTFGPVSTGDHRHAKVSSHSWIAYLAREHLAADVAMAALLGTAGSLVCRVIR